MNMNFNIGKPLDEVFKDIANIAKSYDDDKKKLPLNNKFLQKVTEYIANFTKDEQRTGAKRDLLFDCLISQAACERHFYDLINEPDLAIFYYHIQCSLSTVKCNMV